MTQNKCQTFSHESKREWTSWICNRWGLSICVSGRRNNETRDSEVTWLFLARQERNDNFSFISRRIFLWHLTTPYVLRQTRPVSLSCYCVVIRSFVCLKISDFQRFQAFREDKFRRRISNQPTSSQRVRNHLHTTSAIPAYSLTTKTRYQLTKYICEHCTSDDNHSSPNVPILASLRSGRRRHVRSGCFTTTRGGHESHGTSGEEDSIWCSERQTREITLVSYFQINSSICCLFGFRKHKSPTADSIRFQVSSKHLIMVSSVSKAMLTHSFVEDEALRKDLKVEYLFQTMTMLFLRSLWTSSMAVPDAFHVASHSKSWHLLQLWSINTSSRRLSVSPLICGIQNLITICTSEKQNATALSKPCTGWALHGSFSMTLCSLWVHHTYSVRFVKRMLTLGCS